MVCAPCPRRPSHLPTPEGNNSHQQAALGLARVEGILRRRQLASEPMNLCQQHFVAGSDDIRKTDRII
jgi:hypothetical protein